MVQLSFSLHFDDRWPSLHLNCRIYIYFRVVLIIIFTKIKANMNSLIYASVILLLLIRHVNSSCPGYRGLNGSVCVSCADSQCYLCRSDYRICTRCNDFYGVYAGTCRTCLKPNCGYCWSNYNYCYRCKLGYGFIDGVENSTCVDCLASDCQLCFNYTTCTRCTNGYYVDNSTLCSQCPIIDNCYIYYPICGCDQCSSGYHVVNQSCVTCEVPGCLAYLSECLCNSCDRGYYLDIYRGCSTCNIGGCLSYYYQCYCDSCADGYVLYNRNCYFCSNRMSYCLSCSSMSICDVCQNGTYLNSSGLCQICPTSFTFCTLCYLGSTVQCTQCLTTAYLSNGECIEICGDSLSYDSYQCDNQLYQVFDGCDDNCIIQPGFNCTITANRSTVCSYIDQMSASVVSFHRQKFLNRFTLTIKIYPPLYVFKLAQVSGTIRKLLSVSNPEVEVLDMTYDSSTGQLTVIGDFNQTMANFEITIALDQSMGFPVEFHSSFVVAVGFNLYYYPEDKIRTMKIISYYCFVLMALGWVAFIVGIYLRKLAGLQAMFVLQCSWLVMLWLDSEMIVQYEALYPLKYSSGYNHPFFSEVMSQSRSNPYFLQFSMSKEYFANNFNLCLILPLMSLVAVLVSQIRLAHFLAQRNTLKRQEKYSQETISRLQSLYNQKDRCLSVLMHVVMVNLIYFTASALLFFKFSSEITHPFSLAFLILGLVLFVVTFSLLQYQPVSFKEFTSSFNKKVLFEKHYYLHLLVLSSSVALLGTFTTRPYIALIPSALMAVYTLILQPYKYTRQNLRSVFNYVVMCGWVILKTLIQHYPADSEPIFICYIVHIFGVLTLVVIISFISMAYNTHYEKLMKAKEKEIERQKKINDHRSNIKDKILRDLAKVDVTKQISDLTQQLIFKKTLNENENLLGFSNQKVSSLKEDQAMNEWKESQCEKYEEGRSIKQNFKKNQKKRKKNKHSSYDEEKMIQEMHVEESSVMSALKMYESNRKISQQVSNERHKEMRAHLMESKIHKQMKQMQNKQKQLAFVDNIMAQENEEQESPWIQHQICNSKIINVKKMVETVLVDENKFINYRNAEKIVKQEMEEQEDPEYDEYLNQYELINNTNAQNQ